MANAPQAAPIPLYSNWFKGALALVRTKEGLQDYVTDTIDKFQKQVYIAVSPGSTCHDCAIKDTRVRKCEFYDKSDLSKKPYTCPGSICKDVRDKILASHRLKNKTLTWQNTDASKWGTDSWEIAKCYLTSGGYKNVSTAEETDCSGLISIIINHKDFESTIKEDLSNPSNSFAKVRNFRNLLLHSATIQLTDADMKDYIGSMKNILSDQTYIGPNPTAPGTIAELEKIENGLLEVTDEDEIKVREDALQGNEESKQAAVIIANQQQKAVEHIQREFDEKRKDFEQYFENKKYLLQQYTEDGCRKIKDETQDGVVTVRSKVDECVQRVTETGNECILKLREEKLKAGDEQRKSEIKAYETEKKGLQTELAKMYREYKLRTRIFPANGEERVTIGDIYVTPYLVNVDPRAHGIEDDTNITLYRDIFYKGTTKCKKISISGDAGMGKSALCQSMVSYWCRSHSKQNLSSDEEMNDLSENEKEMLQFEFLFYISLRDIETETKIDDMIKCQLLPERFHGIFKRILDNESEKCLIILDGLDEYIASATCPVRGDMSNYTTLTTSRPHKLEELRLTDSDTDHNLQLRGLEYKSAMELTKSTILLLDKRFHKNMDVKEFEKAVWEMNMEHVFDIPILLKQLICVWYDGKPIGESHCEIYASMIELMLELTNDRVEKYPNVDNNNPTKQSLTKVQLPKCFHGKVKRQDHVNLLHSLAKLSFETLFREDKETSLVFPHTQVEFYGVSKEEISACLQIGILSQSKICRAITLKEKRLSFIHKTFQEFLAALYLVINFDINTFPVERIFTSLNRIFEMSNVFVFVSGMSPKSSGMLSKYILRTAALDDRVKQYREHYANYWTEPGTITRRIQGLLVECIAESPTQGIDVHVEDLFIAINMRESHIKKLFLNSAAHLKSIALDTTAVKPFIGQLSRIKSLHKLSITSNSDVHIDSGVFLGLVGQSSSTLKALEIVFTLKTSKLLDGLTCDQFAEVIDSLSGLKHLRLENIEMTHDKIVLLSNFVLKNTRLSECRVVGIRCLTCPQSECEYEL